MHPLLFDVTKRSASSWVTDISDPFTNFFPFVLISVHWKIHPKRTSRLSVSFYIHNVWMQPFS